MREQLRVALLVETARGFGRELLCGIARYAQVHGPWSFHIRAGDFEHSVPNMKDWRGHGIIARIPNERVAKAVLDANVPTIALGLTEKQKSPGNPLSVFSELSSDAGEVAKLAADYFLERQFKKFAYVGLQDRAWSTKRGKEFGKYLESHGYKVSIYQQPQEPSNQRWEIERPILIDWILKLPKPTALFACNDDRGREVLEACRSAGLNVPEDVAVLGVDNDEVFCGLADPPLSSLALNAESAGYRAAELLHGLMEGRITKPQHVTVEALRVVTRRSTDFNAVEDKDVGAALQFIHQTQGGNISVDQVADIVPISRRMLEKRFRRVIGRTILEEIQITRLERAKQLLLETNFPVSRIADLCGFNTTAYFVQFFKKRLGKTPHRYRTELKVAQF